MKLQLTLVAVVALFLTACGGQVSVYRGTRTSSSLSDGKTFTVREEASAIYLYPGSDENTQVLEGLFSTGIELRRVGADSFAIQPLTTTYSTGPDYWTKGAITDGTATISATKASFTLHGNEEGMGSSSTQRTFTLTFDGQRL